jgi:Fe-S cluster assembly iron-binding protein IscA
VTVDGIEVRVDPQAAVFAAQSVVDYADSMWGKGLTIRPSYGSC